MSDSPVVDVVVVGGGITGLTLASYFNTANRSVLVLEPTVPGGLIASKHIAGFTLENGPNVFVEKQGIRDLIESCGLAQEVCYPATPVYDQLIWNGTKAVPAPKGLRPFVLSPLIPLTDKIRIIRNSFKKNVLLPEQADESVAIFMGRLLGSEVVRRLLDPALKGIYGGRVEVLSARSLFPQLWAAACSGSSLVSYLKKKPARGKIFVLRHGAQSLIGRLNDQLETSIRPVAATGCLRNDNGNWILSCSDHSTIETKNIIFTTSGAASAAVLGSLFPDLSARLAQIPYASLSVVHIAVNDQDLLFERAFGMVFPEGMPQRILGIMFNSVLFPHVAPAGKQLLTVCLGGYQSEADLVHTDPGTAAVLAVQQYLGIQSVEVLNTQFWPHAIPQLLVGHHTLVEDIKQLEANYPGFYYCGTDMGGIGVPDRIESAGAIFRRVIR